MRPSTIIKAIFLFITIFYFSVSYAGGNVFGQAILDTMNQKAKQDAQDAPDDPAAQVNAQVSQGLAGKQQYINCQNSCVNDFRSRGARGRCVDDSSCSSCLQACSQQYQNY